MAVENCAGRRQLHALNRDYGWMDVSSGGVYAGPKGGDSGENKRPGGPRESGLHRDTVRKMLAFVGASESSAVLH